MNQLNHPPGLLVANIAEPPPPPPPGASGLALANTAPSRAELKELQRNIHNMKRRQARLYKERREQTWGSLPEYLDPNVAAVSANLLPSAAQASGLARANAVPSFDIGKDDKDPDDWDITNHELGVQFPHAAQ